MPLIQLTDKLGVKRAAHLLRRACLGGSKTDIDAFATFTPMEAVRQLFGNELPNAGYPIDPTTGQEWITTGNSQNQKFQLRKFFLSWHLGQMVGNGIEESSKLSYIFRERLVFFLHTHFTTISSVVGNSRSDYYQQALFRLFAFDQEDIIVPSEDPEDPESTEKIYPRNFKQLTKKICVDNAMLVFLDGQLNVKGRVNENFARELLELYSIGRGLEGNVPAPEFDGDYFLFTEQDVQEGAKVLSGFNRDKNFNNIDPETGLPRGVIKGGNIARQHEEGIKTFSARLGNGTVIPNEELQSGGRPTEESVLDEISQFVDLIYEQDATPIAICREIYRFFVYHEVDQSLQDNIIKDMAAVFSANEYKIQPVVEALLTSTHFYGAEVGATDNKFGSIIKSPIDLVLGFMRNFDIQLPDHQTESNTYYNFMGNMLEEISNQGMDYYEPFEVAGYAAYHQYPIFNRSWITTTFLTYRYNFIRDRLSNGDNIKLGQVDVFQFVVQNFDIDTIKIADNFIIELAKYLLPVSENLTFDSADDGAEITSERLRYFKTFLLDPGDLDAESAWTFRWENNLARLDRASQIRNLLNAMLQSPEYQLM
ncbi:MAG: DUF1800 family protein [Bacteroidota bacterium]